jgi:hypothetical protein
VEHAIESHQKDPRGHHPGKGFYGYLVAPTVAIEMTDHELLDAAGPGQSGDPRDWLRLIRVLRQHLEIIESDTQPAVVLGATVDFGR